MNKLSLLLLMSLVVAAKAEDWDLHRFEGRDYVTLENVATFYGFSAPTITAEEIKALDPVALAKTKVPLYAGDAQMEVTLKSRLLQINGVNHWLAFPVHVQDGNALISRLDLAKIIEPILRPNVVKFEPVKTVVLDPGHGGHNKGAYSPHGYEKNFALDVCQRAKRLLEQKGLDVVMTRNSDVFVPLETRPKMAKRYPESIFVSVHFNCSLTNPFASGFEIFSATPRGAPSTNSDGFTKRDLKNDPGNALDVQSGILASSIYHSMVGQMAQEDRGVKKARFAVVRLATVPAVLVEGGFLSNTSDAELIASASWREKLARSIVDGIVGFKQLAENKTVFKQVADYRRNLPTRVTLRDFGTTPAAEPTVILQQSAN
jgi:N-acetylmuramoyl-L-alanine amidase